MGTETQNSEVENIITYEGVTITVVGFTVVINVGTFERSKVEAISVDLDTKVVPRMVLNIVIGVNINA